MNQMQLSYQIAKTQKGVKEISGQVDNPKIVEYHQACTLQATDDETAWCSSFANWAYILAGIILNPGQMLVLLIQNKYEKTDIDLFFKSATDAAQRLGYPVGPILGREKTSYSSIKLGTRSAAARSWVGFGVKTKTPKEGDMVVFSRGNNGWSGHIAWFISRGVYSVTHLGGNQSNTVNISSTSRARVLAYITDRT